MGSLLCYVPTSADGQALGSTSLEWSDLYLADGGVIYLGADQDTTLTHVADTGILLNSTRQLQFGDSGTYIHQSADGVLDLVSDTEMKSMQQRLISMVLFRFQAQQRLLVT